MFFHWSTQPGRTIAVQTNYWACDATVHLQRQYMCKIYMYCIFAVGEKGNERTFQIMLTVTAQSVFSLGHLRRVQYFNDLLCTSLLPSQITCIPHHFLPKYPDLTTQLWSCGLHTCIWMRPNFPILKRVQFWHSHIPRAVSHCSKILARTMCPIFQG